MQRSSFKGAWPADPSLPETLNTCFFMAGCLISNKTVLASLSKTSGGRNNSFLKILLLFGDIFSSVKNTVGWVQMIWKHFHFHF